MQSRMCFFSVAAITNRPLNTNFVSNTKSTHIISLLKKYINNSLFSLYLTAMSYFNLISILTRKDAIVFINLTKLRKITIDYYDDY